VKDKTITAYNSWIDDGGAVTVRRATPADEIAISRLAVLDSARPVAGEVLVAEIGGELWAALSIDDGHLIADPFRATRVARELLALRARHLRAAAAPPRQARGRRLVRMLLARH
jgi:hypothetical protein